MNKTIYKIGFWSGLVSFTSTLAFCVVQLLQVVGVISFPLDEMLIYVTSLCIVIPFVLEILALYYITSEDKKIYSHAALIFSIMYAVFVTSNYVVQLATVIPMQLKGALQEVKVLKQTPHSLFWDFDAIGYICMGFATLFAIPVFEKQGFQKWVRISFLANALATPLIAFVYFYPTFSARLYILGFSWGITAPLSMIMLTILFRKKMKATIQ
ncbi:MAG: hypothetical protein ABIP30_00605 [Ferruginibacter sp.]